MLSLIAGYLATAGYGYIRYDKAKTSSTHQCKAHHHIREEDRRAASGV